MAGGTSQTPASDEQESAEQAPFVDINVTPLVDIFLVLLVILMATSTAILEAGQGQGSGFKVQLPRGSQSDEVQPSGEDFIVAVPKEGPIIFRGEQVSMTELEGAFQIAAARSPEQLVLVQADEDAKHKRVVEVMDAARKAGLRNLAIATRPE